MPYKNPIPQLPEEKVFKIVITFRFEDSVTEKEATKGIADVILERINQNGGRIPASWIVCVD